MQQKNLTGYIFKGSSNIDYVVLSGYEGNGIVFEQIDIENSPLQFCLDAYLSSGKMKGSYFVSYTVSKKEFFSEIESFTEENKKDADTIASALKEKYYKIPTVFLKLVGEAWLKERKNE